MYDTPEPDHRVVLGRDLPCPKCDHSAHPYLACSPTCDCEPVRLPGSAA